MEPLRVALVEVRGNCNFSENIAEAARLYKEDLVDKVYLFGGDFSRLYYAGKDCARNVVPAEDVINNKPNLPSFVREYERGVGIIIVVTSWLSCARAWHRFGKMPKWVWNLVEFRITALLKS
jgi:hypothetical protein